MNENTNTNTNANTDAGAVQDPPVAAPVEQAVVPGKIRAAGVKGVTKAAKDLKAAGKTRAEVAAAVIGLYKAAGKDEKAAKNAASVIVYNIFGAVKPHATPTTPSTNAMPTTPSTNA